MNNIEGSVQLQKYPNVYNLPLAGCVLCRAGLVGGSVRSVHWTSSFSRQHVQVPGKLQLRESLL